MKKTLIAFSVTVMLSIVLFLGIGLTGCDWFNTSVLGKQNKTELPVVESNQAELDSIHKAAIARLAELEAKDEADKIESNKNKPFHIVIGSFEEKENVDKAIEEFKSHGYNPQTFRMDYLTCVSAISFETLSEAETALKSMLQLDYCPEDAWVHKK